MRSLSSCYEIVPLGITDRLFEPCWQRHPRLEIVEYPVAAPELYPQEQVWKQSRRAISHNHVYPKLLRLADAFERPLTNHYFHSSFLHDYGFDLVCPFLN